MARLVRITGVRQVRANMRKYTVDQGQAFSAGLRKAGILLQNLSMRICPVDQGPLRASAFTRKFGSGYRTDVVVGYTKKYAAYVHEDIEAFHGQAFNEEYAEEIARRKPTAAVFKRKFGNKPPRERPYFRARGPNQQAKFLEKPARENRPEMLAIIAGEASSIL